MAEEIENPKLQSYILLEQKKELLKLRDTDHDLKNQLSTINLKVAVIEKKQDIVQEDITQLTEDMQEVKEALNTKKGAEQFKEKMIKLSLTAFGTFGVGDVIYHFFKNYPV